MLLYELLDRHDAVRASGCETAALDEMLRLIREEEPPRPSARLEQLDGNPADDLAAAPQTDPAQLARLVRGELDWIVMKIAGEGPHPALRVGQRHGPRHRALPCRRTGRSVPAVDDVSPAQVRPQASRPADDGDRFRAGAARRHRDQRLASARREPRGATTRRARQAADKDRDKAVNISKDLDQASEKLRRVLYVSDMNLVSVAWDHDQPERASALLERHRPKPGARDLRGFEWHYWQRRLHTETRTVQLEGFGDRFLEQLEFSQPQLSASGRRCAHAALKPGGAVDLKVWDTLTGKVILSQIVPWPDTKWRQDLSLYLAFSPDERALAVMAF